MRRGCRAGVKKQTKKRIVGEGIINISGGELTREEIKVLDKGLKFAPKKNLNTFNAYVDINKFTRSLHIKKYMLSNPGDGREKNISDTNGILFSSLRNKSL